MRISDWSSDVCSSDLRAARKPVVDLFGRDRCAIVEGEEPKKRARRPARLQPGVEPRLERIARFITDPACHGAAGLDQLVRALDRASHLGRRRSEERRVGKECVSRFRSRWLRLHLKNNKHITNYASQ